MTVPNSRHCLWCCLLLSGCCAYLYAAAIQDHLPFNRQPPWPEPNAYMLPHFLALSHQPAPRLAPRPVPESYPSKHSTLWFCNACLYGSWLCRRAFLHCYRFTRAKIFIPLRFVYCFCNRIPLTIMSFFPDMSELLCLYFLVPWMWRWSCKLQSQLYGFI